MAAAKKKAPAKKTAARKKATSSRSSTARSTPAKRKVPAKKTAAKKTAAKTSTTKRGAKKTAAKRAATKKSAARTAAAKTSAKKRASTSRTPTTSRKKQVSSSTSSPSTRRSTSSGGILSNERPEAVEIPRPRGTTKDGIAYTKDFDVKFLKAQREELLARRESELKRATRLEDEAESLIEDGEMGDVQFDDEGGEGDTMVVQRDLDRVLSSQARQAVEEIDAALRRIEAGTYGYSVVSGLPIPRERLEAIPETTVLAAEKVSGIGV